MTERRTKQLSGMQEMIDKRVASELAHLFDGDTPESLDSYEAHYEPIEQYFPDYFEGSKLLGDVDEGKLLTIAVNCLSYLRTPDDSTNFKVSVLELGASALTEAAFIRTISEHASIEHDERLQAINLAENMLQSACRIIGDDRLASYRRLDIKRSFSDIQRDIVCGEISAQSVDEIRQKLADHLDEVHRIENYTERAGVEGELRVLLHYWNQYEKPGQHVAIPATVRGDNGKYHKETTHDIDIIRQKNDRNWLAITPVEVKNYKVLPEAILMRYTGVNIATFDSDDNVIISGEHRYDSDFEQSA